MRCYMILKKLSTLLFLGETEVENIPQNLLVEVDYKRGSKALKWKTLTKS